MTEGRFKAKEGFWETFLPIRIEEGGEGLRFMTKSLGRYDDPLAAPYITSLRTRVDGTETTIYFLYGEDQMDLVRKKAINVIRVSKEPEREAYSVTLDSEGLLEAANSTGTFVRKILLRWPLSVCSGSSPAPDN